jgi:hypothetical protein
MNRVRNKFWSDLLSLSGHLPPGFSHLQAGPAEFARRFAFAGKTDPLSDCGSLS